MTKMGLVTEVAVLARKAERWGAGPQGTNLALVAEHLSTGSIKDAMAARDKIAAALHDARVNRVLLITALALAATPFIGMAVYAFF